MSDINILVVDDDKEIAELIEIYLVSDGYKVWKAYNAKEGLEILDERSIDLVLLDIMMPGMNGLEMCKKIRTYNNIPIIILSARSNDLDKILGLGSGADDYVTKPFSMKVLLKKIAIMLKREKQDRNCYQDDFLKIDFNLAMVEVNQKICSITPTEYRILKKFIENKGQLLTYNMFLDALWQEGVQLMDKHALAVNINRLRKKIEDENHSYITNVYGMGYIWK